MAMGEDNGVLGEIKELSDEQVEALDKVKSLSKELKAKEGLHVGIKDELERHKQLIGEIKEINRKLDMIMKHFNIYPIVQG